MEALTIGIKTSVHEVLHGPEADAHFLHPVHFEARCRTYGLTQARTQPCTHTRTHARTHARTSAARACMYMHVHRHSHMWHLSEVGTIKFTDFAPLVFR